MVRRLWGLQRVCPCFCSFALLFVLWLSFLWLSFVVLFPALSLVLLFPFRMCRQKERARRVAPCVLSYSVVGVVLDVLKHHCNSLRFIVPKSPTFANDSCDLFRLVRWAVHDLPGFVNY